MKWIQLPLINSKLFELPVIGERKHSKINQMAEKKRRGKKNDLNIFKRKGTKTPSEIIMLLLDNFLPTRKWCIKGWLKLIFNLFYCFRNLGEFSSSSIVWIFLTYSGPNKNLMNKLHNVVWLLDLSFAAALWLAANISSPLIRMLWNQRRNSKRRFII